MKKSIIQLVFIGSVLGLIIPLNSCKQEGCKEEYSSNFDEKAKEDDGSCVFPSRTISFYTTGNLGGKIFIELSSNNVDNGSYGNGEVGKGLSPALGNNLIFDEKDNYYPKCGSFNLVSFNRFTSESYSYKAVDEKGDFWFGQVSASEGECKLVEINRDSSVYGKVFFYSNSRIDSSEKFLITRIPQWSPVERFRKQHYWILGYSLYKNRKQDCVDKLASYISVKEGEVVFEVSYQTQLPKEFKIDVKAGECNYIDLSDYLGL